MFNRTSPILKSTSQARITSRRSMHRVCTCARLCETHSLDFPPAPFHAITIKSVKSSFPPLYRARNAQLANLAQHILHPRVEVATGVLVASRSVEVLLHLGHAAVGFGAEAELDLDEGFECGVKVGYSRKGSLRLALDSRWAHHVTAEHTSGRLIEEVRSSIVRSTGRTQPWPVPICQSVFE